MYTNTPKNVWYFHCNIVDGRLHDVHEALTIRRIRDSLSIDNYALYCATQYGHIDVTRALLRAYV